jgi:NAD(P) transhydrogenase subunit alpha
MPTVLIPKETRPGETRVAATPASIKRYIKDGFTVVVESGAGAGSSISDDEYKEAGASIATDRTQALGDADVVLMVNVPESADASLLKEGASTISYLWPYDNLELVKLLADRKVSAFAMDAIPRITRAQKDDALSSQANLAGYKAVVLGACEMPKILPMMTTAAGTIRPAKVVIIGAGVAGLQAIATAKRLGAIVEVSDVRPEVKEQAESLGATYIEVEGVETKAGEGGYASEQSDEFKRKQQELLHQHVAAADMVVCTALIPYRPAPKIITAAMVRDMRDGSVIVDLAAERGGNCELTAPGETVVREGIKIIGCIKLEDTVPVNASDVYAKNIQNVITDYTKDGALVWDLEDEIVAGALVTHGGDVIHAKTREALKLPPLEKPAPPEEEKAEDEGEEKKEEGDASNQEKSS